MIEKLPSHRNHFSHFELFESGTKVSEGFVWIELLGLESVLAYDYLIGLLRCRIARFDHLLLNLAIQNFGLERLNVICEEDRTSGQQRQFGYSAERQEETKSQ
jgi:hypothetical protein